MMNLPLSALARASTCRIVDSINCCPCEMGGGQGAINRDKLLDLSRQLLACCDRTVRLAVLCEDQLGAGCEGGTCTLVRQPTATARPTPTATPGPIEFWVFRH